MQYFIPLDVIKINKPVTRSRFIYTDRHGHSALPTDVGASKVPMGISYDTEMTSVLNQGWAKYYNTNYPRPVPLELASAVTVNTLIKASADGRGIPVNMSLYEDVGYALATESGDVGDYIMVLPVYQHYYKLAHAFSTGFDYQQFN